MTILKINTVMCQKLGIIVSGQNNGTLLLTGKTMFGKIIATNETQKRGKIEINKLNHAILLGFDFPLLFRNGF